MGEVFLNNSMEAIKDILMEDAVDEYYTKFELFKGLCDYKKIDYCIDKYIAAEFDCRTTGNRGIGRINDNVPRFGGYFRKQMSNLSDEKINELANLFKQSIYIGYLTHVLFMEETLKTPVVISEQLLFEKWIPGIYV